MSEAERSARFEELIWPHLGAAYNLARWLTRRDSDADDVVQEAMLRAFRFFDQHNGDSKAWLLAIVRNTCYTWLRKNRARDIPSDLDVDHADEKDKTPGPEERAVTNADHETLHRALQALPLEFREILVLRELENCSYQEISEVSGVPMGTVMSRLARARGRLQQLLSKEHSGEPRDL